MIGQADRSSCTGERNAWAAVAAGAIGPLVGGRLIDSVGWRAMFLLNIPVAIGGLILGARFAQDWPMADKAPLDWVGAVLATAGLAGFSWGLTSASGQDGWTGPAAISMGAGGVLLVRFVRFEHKRGAGQRDPRGPCAGPRARVPGATSGTYQSSGGRSWNTLRVPAIHCCLSASK
jgi:MFS family permease